MPTAFTAFVDRMHDSHEAFRSAEITTLGERIAAVSQRVTEQLYAVDATEKTLIHGDYKSPNIFFSLDGGAAVIDFQWAGPGVAASDVIYLFATSAAPESLPAVPELLNHYFTTLNSVLKATGKGVYSTISFNFHYNLACVDCEWRRMCSDASMVWRRC